jgi:hypothetical protein
MDDHRMGRVDALTMRALAFGLDVEQDPEQVAAGLVHSAGQDGRLLRKAVVRVERGCRQRHTSAEDRTLWVLGLALSAVDNPSLGMIDVPRCSSCEVSVTRVNG